MLVKIFVQNVIEHCRLISIYSYDEGCSQLYIKIMHLISNKRIRKRLNGICSNAYVREILMTYIHTGPPVEVKVTRLVNEAANVNVDIVFPPCQPSWISVWPVLGRDGTQVASECRFIEFLLDTTQWVYSQIESRWVFVKPAWYNPI